MSGSGRGVSGVCQSSGLFVVRRPEDLTRRRAALEEEQQRLAEEKVVLQLRLGQVLDRELEVAGELWRLRGREQEGEQGQHEHEVDR